MSIGTIIGLRTGTSIHGSIGRIIGTITLVSTTMVAPGMATIVPCPGVAQGKAAGVT